MIKMLFADSYRHMFILIKYLTVFRDDKIEISQQNQNQTILNNDLQEVMSNVANNFVPVVYQELSSDPCSRRKGGQNGYPSAGSKLPSVTIIE